MHYYQFNIGDYKSHTDHLDLLEDLAFRRMMDWCYLHESPLPLDLNVIAKKILMRTHTDSIASVLEEFFQKTEEGYFNKRISSEVEAFKAKSDKARKSAEARWNKVKTDSEGNANALRTDSEGNAKHKTLNTKQETLNIKQSNSPTVVSEDTQTLPDTKVSDEDVSFAQWFYEKLLELNPKQKKPNFNKWADTIRLIRSVDKKSYQEMSDLFMWVNSSDFWKGNILSPVKFRKHWDMLVIQMSKETGKNDINAISTNFDAPEDWNNE